MIKLIASTSEFISWRNSISRSVGLVPTMGNLHSGHLSLVEQSVKENECTVVTIFVNPKQFGPGEDYEQYPRTLDDDLEKLKTLDGDIIVFAPKDNSEIYPEGFQTQIALPELSKILCGKSRPTHFAGVTTVVYQLFTLVKPELAYFGQKDYQQVKIIERMTKDLRLTAHIKMLPIIRDHDGLALSSRNQYLNDNQRQDALILPRTIEQLSSVLNQEGLSAVLSQINDITKNPVWDYLEILEANSLRAPQSGDKFFVLVGAVFMGKTRLLDNKIVELNVR
ncbi:MAG: pantoate--beta-alanine ligase [Bdellovibrionales bacterium CG12_big_fil_rev_8_21_14_0_65_38_15]|nr:MAG: pantoate--beta-alanine ligase [Bdellovibrionales bacterium CG22_combo_CG10-13_8_21_14_all_38_13]PIQ54741.1 MAG: pantoate--beta-alanine ligase [Bdellovibrionales bacterium CG12_big_fil_rev_8_21_14_0_65_38_15]PIR31296.1 MAG: pantoate--beta-alanine ligase [Bdellovibrionales bacterium CG11_big_fil_rev_8_21_14_0_20_38_13]